MLMDPFCDIVSPHTQICLALHRGILEHLALRKGSGY